MAEAAGRAEPSIRAQAKKSKGQQANAGDKGGTSKSVVKAVLANPLTVPWPSIPRHLQTTVLANLPAFVPTEVAEYHTDRARCHQADKRKKRSATREEAAKEKASNTNEAVNHEGTDADINSLDVATPVAGPSRVSKKRDVEDPSTGQTAKRSKPSTVHPINTRTPSARPDRPAILPHLVFGINEVIKSLEAQMSALRLRVMMIGDALADKQKGGRQAVKGGASGRTLLPTAPPREDEESSSEEEEEVEMAEAEGAIVPATPTETGPAVPIPTAETPKHLQSADPPAAPLEWIVIPLLSISPATLVSPIPAYCATYNTLVYQHTHISKIARTRLPVTRADELIGTPPEEVRVVPLGKVQEEMAALAGLRRVACLASSHPQIDIMRKLLPKSILHPPRHSLTLPFPTSALIVPSALEKQANGGKVASSEDTARSSRSTDKHAKAVALLPHIHYAPLHVKGITTTIPADGNAKKQKRMEEVRAKRRLAKERKKIARTAAK